MSSLTSCYWLLSIHFWTFTICYLLLTMYCPIFIISHGLWHVYCFFPRCIIYYSCDSRGCNGGTSCEHHGNIMSHSKFRRRSRRSSTNVHGMQFLVTGQPSAVVDIGEWYIYDGQCFNYVTGYYPTVVPHTSASSLYIIYNSLYNSRVSSIHY